MIRVKQLAIFSNWKLGNDIISANRPYLMGYAIIFVILYHLQSWVIPQNFKILSYGYIGVDVFMFLSGFGLYNSLKRNKDIKEFYWRRISRILPSFVFFVIICTLILYNKGVGSFFKFILDLTTVSYYLNFEPLDWYLNATILFYFFYPAFFVLIDRIPNRVNLVGITIFWISLFVILSICERDKTLEWINLWYAINRIPIFLLGSVFAKGVPVKNTILLLIISILGFVYFKSITEYSWNCQILATSFLTLFIIAFLSYLPSIGIIRKLGKYTLQIYCSNIITFYILDLFGGGTFQKIFIYVVSQIFFVSIFVVFNKKINTLLKI